MICSLKLYVFLGSASSLCWFFCGRQKQFIKTLSSAPNCPINCLITAITTDCSIFHDHSPSLSSTFRREVHQFSTSACVSRCWGGLLHYLFNYRYSVMAKVGRICLSFTFSSLILCIIRLPHCRLSQRVCLTVVSTWGWARQSQKGETWPLPTILLIHNLKPDLQTLGEEQVWQSVERS